MIGNSEEQAKKIEETLLKTAKAIQDDFLAYLKIEVPIDYIKSKLSTMEKLGVTNQFITEFTVEEKTYFVRINGKLWPPYTRDSEEEALKTLKKHNIQTNVLFNGKITQICEKPNRFISLAHYLESNNNQAITETLKALASLICIYQKLPSPNVQYPIRSMLSDRNLAAFYNKFESSPGIATKLKFLGSKIDKIVTILEKQRYCFGQNDLVPSSVFYDLNTQQLTIVDWEYGALASWSNDMAILGGYLTTEQLDILTNSYYKYQKGKDEMPPLQRDIVEFNEFAYSLLYKLIWKANPDNIAEHLNTIDTMIKQANGFDERLNLAFDRLNSDNEKLTESPLLTTEEKSKSVEYRPLIQPAVSVKRVWLSKKEREIFYTKLDKLILPILEKLHILSVLPSQKFQDRASTKGWQLFSDIGQHDHKNGIAVLNLEDLSQVETLINAFSKSNVSNDFRISSGISEQQPCIIFRFDYQSNAIESSLTKFVDLFKKANLSLNKESMHLLEVINYKK